MKGSWTIFRAFDIPVRIHWSFVLVVFVISMLAGDSGGSPTDYFWATALIGSMFVCVLLHEYGHALAARRFGIVTYEIILSPIGGLARMNALPSKPLQELWIAVAGPLVNALIALLLGASLLFVDIDEVAWQFRNQIGPPVLGSVTFLPFLLILNVVLVVFNMVPAFPMDGGRVLRALLSLRLTRVRATFVAARIGQAIGVAMLLYGLATGAYSLAVISLFVMVMAEREYKSLRQWDLLNRTTAAQIMQPIEPLFAAQELNSVFPQTEHPIYPVVDAQNNPTGWLPHRFIPRVTSEVQTGRVRDVAIMQVPPIVMGDANLESVIGVFRQSRTSFSFVIDKGILVGVITEPLIRTYLDERR